MKRTSFWYTIALFLVIIFTIVPRLYKLTAPIADWHSFRQVDTASVAREFTKKGIDLLHPTYHDLSNIQSGKDNPKGWRMVEFPLYQGIAAFLAMAVPRIPLEVWLRLVTIAFAVVTAASLVVLMKHLISERAGILAGLLYALLPYSIYYGRTVLPETMAVGCALFSIVVLLTDTEGDRDVRSLRSLWRILVSGVVASLALLIKPTAGFLLLPIPFVLYRKYGISLKSFLYTALFALMTLVPFFWWRTWIEQYPEGIAAYTWLFNKGDIRFKGAWFEWLFAERIGKLILGFWGLIPLGFGLVAPTSKKEGWSIHLIALGSTLYLIVLAAGNVQHDYYQIILLPALSLYLGKGIDWLLSAKQLPLVPRYALLCTSVLFMLAFSYFTIRTYYWINRPEIIEAGQMADKILPKNAKVIAPYNGDTTFLYQTNRTGWPLGFDIDQKIKMGATHYVTVSPTDQDFETMTLSKQYTVLVRNDRYAIIDITKPKQ